MAVSTEARAGDRAGDRAGRSRSCTCAPSAVSAHPKWSGQCSGCGDWNTLVEEIEGSVGADVPLLPSHRAGPTPIGDVRAQEGDPITTSIVELDRVLGGGLVPGSVTLLGGEPGIGKSTLLLQLLAAWDGPTLYVTAEESAHQVQRRAQRLGAIRDELWLHAETSLPHIIAAIDATKPELVVIDSIQTVHDPATAALPGSVGQVRGCAQRLVVEAKDRNVAVVLVGHVTKDGGLAGPRVLEHVVDTVLQFEGDRHHALAPVAGVQAPIRADQRTRTVRDGPRGSDGRARSVDAVPRRSPRRHRRLGGRPHHGGPPSHRRRGAGVDDRRRTRRSVAPQRPGPRRRSPLDADGGHRPARQDGDRRSGRVRVDGWRREAHRAGPRSRGLPRRRQRDHRSAAPRRSRGVRRGRPRR